ncbi:hypothetical protein ACFWFI_26280 [Streptomyces sp. NPDC060209]|uniref:hypothetical protein n=1 Tax=Streptomyces sp. NPDC060209 TaxID=3347073 RepID=UPI003663C413
MISFSVRMLLASWGAFVCRDVLGHEVGDGRTDGAATDVVLAGQAGDRLATQVRGAYAVGLLVLDGWAAPALADEAWEGFLGHFERRRLALGDCGRAYGTSCIHEHSCLRCGLLRPDPDQRPCIEDIGENLRNRIAEAEREGWIGEVEGLKVSRAGAMQKLAQLHERTRRTTTVKLGIPAFRDIVSRTITADMDSP